MSEENRRVELMYIGLGAASGFIMACFGLAVTVAWVTEAGLGPVQLIVLGSVLEASVLVAEVPTGVVADTISRKWSIITSFVLVGIGVIMNMSNDFALLLLAQAVWGVGFTFQSGADTAWVTDELGRSVDRLIIQRARWQQVGLIAGVVVGILVGALSLDGAIALAGGASLIVAGVLAVTMPETGFAPVPASERSTWRSMMASAVAGANVLREYPITRIVIVAALIGGFASEVVDRLMVLRLVDVGVPGFEPVVMIGALMILARGTVWIALWRLEPRLDTTSDVLAARLIAAAYGLTALAVVALAVGPVFALAGAGHVVQTSSRHVVHPIEVAVVNRKATSQHRATILSFHGQADALGQVAGGMSLALVAYLTTVSTAMMVGAGLFAVAAVLVAAVPRADS